MKPHHTDVCTYTAPQQQQHNECVPVFVFIYYLQSELFPTIFGCKKECFTAFLIFRPHQSKWTDNGKWWWCWGVRAANTEHKCAKSYSMPFHSMYLRFFRMSILSLCHHLFTFFRINNPLGFALTLWYILCFISHWLPVLLLLFLLLLPIYSPHNTHTENIKQKRAFYKYARHCASSDDNVCQLTLYSSQ